MTNYTAITNEDGLPYSNFFWAYLNEFNRRAVEVTDWSLPIIAIPNTSRFGLKMTASGDYTIFRKNKVTGVVDFMNHTAIVCGAISTAIVFIPAITAPDTGYNFKVTLTMAELGGNLLSAFSFGYSTTQTGEITNWQLSNVFNIIDEGVYFFDVKLTNATSGTVGKQSVELYINQDNVNFGGGDESDNQQPGTGSSED